MYININKLNLEFFTNLDVEHVPIISFVYDIGIFLK